MYDGPLDALMTACACPVQPYLVKCIEYEDLDLAHKQGHLSDFLDAFPDLVIRHDGKSKPCHAGLGSPSQRRSGKAGPQASTAGKRSVAQLKKRALQEIRSLMLRGEAAVQKAAVVSGEGSARKPDMQVRSHSAEFVTDASRLRHRPYRILQSACTHPAARHIASLDHLQISRPASVDQPVPGLARS